ncbi:MAG: hypothetical protein GF388_10970 [Candidatus Aegiribacteria sp.]|nr:hypothetical protein [Candidatus Aegiribacteria sp.]MBD3295523.1 hypothetical protein [Candidatus Fermentibacteria bacterium]
MKLAILVLALTIALAAGKSVVDSFDAPDGDISGLGWENGELWGLDAFNKVVYRIDPTSGNVIDSFSVGISSSYEGTGLAVENGTVFVGAWDNGSNVYVYKYDTSGNYIAAYSMCGG